MPDVPFLPLKDYLLLGDLHSSALLGKNGSIDWLCWPHFDSPAVFARVLDKNGGCFALRMDGWDTKAEYRKNTAIADTVFSKGERSFTVTDFMVPQKQREGVMHLIIRKFHSSSSKTDITLLFDPRPDFGRADYKIRTENGRLEVFFGNKKLLLHLPAGAETKKSGKSMEINFVLHPDEIKTCALEFSSKDEYSYSGEDLEPLTERFWKNWVKRGHYPDVQRSGCIRSAITLKLMQFRPTGALIAAPTTSLPEAIGSERNWDYRYVWIRDATFILYALQLLGHTDEAVYFFRYIDNIVKDCAPDNLEIKLMYDIEGDPVPDETHLKYLSGYMDSSPVRTGNGAKNQFQLDVYGSMIDAYYFMSKKGILPSPLSKKLMLSLAERIEELWQEKDSGIWEVRGEQHRYTYSRVMAWVGLDRLLIMRHELGLNHAQITHYKTLQKKIYNWIWDNCFDGKRKVFRQHPNSQCQDATNFLFVLLKFLDKYDPLTKEIINNTADELAENDIFVYRYKCHDNLKGHEGAFLLCSYWYISALAYVDEVKKAEKLLRKLNKYFAESGLISEEMNPSGAYLGNFPQAFSHIGYITSAHYIDKFKKRNIQLAQLNKGAKLISRL